MCNRNRQINLGKTNHRNSTVINYKAKWIQQWLLRILLSSKKRYNVSSVSNVERWNGRFGGITWSISGWKQKTPHRSIIRIEVVTGFWRILASSINYCQWVAVVSLDFQISEEGQRRSVLSPSPISGVLRLPWSFYLPTLGYTSPWCSCLSFVSSPRTRPQ